MFLDTITASSVLANACLVRTMRTTNYRLAFLVGYHRSVPKLRQANHCIGCEIYKPHCPQAIDIPSEMRRIDQ